MSASLPLGHEFLPVQGVPNVCGFEHIHGVYCARPESEHRRAVAGDGLTERWRRPFEYAGDAVRAIWSSL